MPYQVLIADELHSSIFEMLEQIGVKYNYSPQITRAEITEKLSDYEGLIIRSKTKIDSELLQNAHKLKFIARAGAGLDLIDIQETSQRNIALFSANEGNRDAVAEHTMGMVLSLFNKINTANAEVKAGIWQREPNRGEELMGKTWGIIGFGNNGSATAKRLSGFEVTVLAYDKFNKNFSSQTAKEATLEEIFEKADIVSLHIPLTDETYKMVNHKFINQFKKNIYLINIARGEILVLADLLKNLQTGKVLGTCLDVLENEKITKLNDEEKTIFEALAALPNTILTPHVAGWTHESYVKINQVLVDKIAGFIQKSDF